MVVPPERYNALYAQFRAEGKNLNHLLAWGQSMHETDQGFRPSTRTAATAGAGVALAPNATGLLAQYARPVPLHITVSLAGGSYGGEYCKE